MSNVASPIDLVTLFISALLLLLICAAILLRAAKRPINIDSDAKSKIYAQQLKELDADIEYGRINQSEYDAARSEILRRILKHSGDNKVVLTNQNAPKTALFSIAFIALTSCAIYYFIGQPNLKDLPSFKREKEILSRPPETLSQNEIMLVLQARAQKDPKDPIPHLLMGKVLLADGRANDALHAFQATLRRDNNSAEALAEIGGTIFELNGGKIDEEFSNAINAALQIDKNNISAHFYKGLGLWRNGNKQDALDIWRQSFTLFGNNEMSRLSFLARIIDELSRLDIGPQMGGDAPIMGGGNPQDFIKSMIERRKQKLLENPKDISLRLSLARVLAKNDYAKSQEILNDGLKIYSQGFEHEVFLAAIKMNSKDGVK